MESSLTVNQARAALLRNSEMLQAIFNNVPVMIALWDTSGPGGHLLLVNQEWERVLGWTLEEAQRIDLSVATLPDPRERQRVVEDFHRANGGFGLRVRAGGTKSYIDEAARLQSLPRPAPLRRAAARALLVLLRVQPPR